MADFRKRLLGVAGAAMLFSGIASAQFTCTTLIPTAGSGLIRAEGQTELIQQLTINGCTAGAGVIAATTNGTVQIFLSSAAGPVTITSPATTLAGTSQVLTGGQVTPSGGNVVPPNATEAQLTVTGPGQPATVYYGTASGGTLTFSNVNLADGGGVAAPTSFVISNVRVNASQVSATGGPVPINAIGYVSVTGPTVVATTTSTTSPALVITGLQTTKVFKDAGQASTGIVGVNNPFGVCGNINASSTGASATPNFFVSVNENFAVAFKSKNGTGAANGTLYASGSESSNLGNDVAVTLSGTRIQISFSGIPAGLNVFLPLSVLAPDGAVLTAISAPNGGVGSAPIAATSPSSVNGVLNNTFAYFQAGVTAGAATGYYEVTTDNAGLDAFSVPVILNAGSNTVANQSGNVTVSVSFAPQSATVTGAAPSAPLFVLSNNPANVLGFTLCQTSLLFPFVTNQAGFETGLAISNTTKDPNNQAKAQSGTCMLNYYGTGGTNPVATLAPNNNEGPVGGVFAAGESYAFTLTSALAIGSGNPATFQGYVIAVCQFQDAHGFAYITYQFPGPSSSTMGYLALVLNRGNLSTGAESLSQ